MSIIVPHLSEIISPIQWEYYMGHAADFIEDYVLAGRAKYLGGTAQITDQQLLVLESVANNRRTTVKAGRGVGKTCDLAWLTMWWCSMFEMARVVATAPTFPQLQSVLWPEVAKWLSGSQLEPYFIHTAKRLYLLEDPKNNFAEPRTASREESAQGLHGLHLLIMMDEAPGIDDNIYKVIKGSMTSLNNKMVLMGNPARTSGFFYDSFHRNKRHWNCITLNAEESPVVDKGELAEWKEMYVTNGRVHDMYKIHVLGEFPSGDPEAYLGIESVDKAVQRGRLLDRYGKLIPSPQLTEGAVEVAIDFARKGVDTTCCASRQGNWVFSAQELGLIPESEDGWKEDLYTKGQTTGPEAEQMVYDVVDATRAVTGYQGVIRVKCDITGVGGYAADHLELDTEHNIEVIPCNFGGAGDETAHDECSIMWKALKDRLDKIHLPNDRFMSGELSTRRFEYDARTRIAIESKKVYKHDFGASPDRADVIVMLFSDKDNERCYVKPFNPADTQTHTYESKYLRGGEKYCAVYCSPSQEVSVILSTWFGGKLRIYDEFIGDTIEATYFLKNHGPYKKIIGNSTMFNVKEDDLALEFAKSGVYIREQYGYNEIGAINHLSRLAENKDLVIAKECYDTFSLFRRWTANRSKGELKEKFGLCYAVTHIVSDLVKTNKITIVSNDPNVGFMSLL